MIYRDLTTRIKAPAPILSFLLKSKRPVLRRPFINVESDSDRLRRYVVYLGLY